MVGTVSTEFISKHPKEERDAMALDLDELYEHTLKIFGDVFESLIGAVFLDCRDSELTWKVLEKLIMPYIKVYADLDTMQDHSRTKLLELWN
jgi:dsRNA-specific ribonuclease